MTLGFSGALRPPRRCAAPIPALYQQARLRLTGAELITNILSALPPSLPISNTLTPSLRSAAAYGVAIKAAITAADCAIAHSDGGPPLDWTYVRQSVSHGLYVAELAYELFGKFQSELEQTTIIDSPPVAAQPPPPAATPQGLNAEVLGANIAAACVAWDWTTEDLARRAGIPSATLDNPQCGNNAGLAARQLCVVADLLGIRLDTLITGTVQDAHQEASQARKRHETDTAEQTLDTIAEFILTYARWPDDPQKRAFEAALFFPAFRRTLQARYIVFDDDSQTTIHLLRTLCASTHVPPEVCLVASYLLTLLEPTATFDFETAMRVWSPLDQHAFGHWLAMAPTDVETGQQPAAEASDCAFDEGDTTPYVSTSSSQPPDPDDTSIN